MESTASSIRFVVHSTCLCTFVLLNENEAFAIARVAHHFFTDAAWAFLNDWNKNGSNVI